MSLVIIEIILLSKGVSSNPRNHPLYALALVHRLFYCCSPSIFIRVIVLYARANCILSGFICLHKGSLLIYLGSVISIIVVTTLQHKVT